MAFERKPVAPATMSNRTAPLCPVCGRDNWPAQDWMHKACGAVRLPNGDVKGTGLVDTVTETPAPSRKPKGGRPRKVGALTTAERAKAYRKRRRGDK
jgi:hypothetical protein